MPHVDPLQVVVPVAHKMTFPVRDSTDPHCAISPVPEHGQPGFGCAHSPADGVRMSLPAAASGRPPHWVTSNPSSTAKGMVVTTVRRSGPDPKSLLLETALERDSKEIDMQSMRRTSYGL